MNKFSFLQLIVLLCLSASSHAKPKNIKKILIDTDIGLGKIHHEHKNTPSDIDDAYAIIHALRSPELEVMGITSVFGNSKLSSVNESLKTILKLSKNQSIPWASGASQANSEFDQCSVGAKSAADFLAKRLTVDPTYILAIGPLTNIACLIQNHPKVIERIRGILVVMGQSKNTDFSINNIPISDFDFESDINAARVVIESKIPLYIFPFELTRQSLVTSRKLDELLARDTLTQHLKSAGSDYIEHWLKTFKENGFHPWDSAPVAYFENPEWFKCEYRDLRIEDYTGHKKLIAGSSQAKDLPWLFCYDFSSNSSREDFESQVIKKINYHADQSVTF